MGLFGSIKSKVSKTISGKISGAVSSASSKATGAVNSLTGKATGALGSLGGLAGGALGGDIGNIINKISSSAASVFGKGAVGALGNIVENIIGGGFGSVGLPTNTYESYSSRCRARIYHYKDVNPDPSDNSSGVLDAEVIDLDNNNDNGNPILSFTYTKSNSAAGGYFQMVLAPSENWIQRIKPGDWIAIYLSNGGDESLRCLGNVDTIGMSERPNPSNGARHFSFTVSGRDFGKVFEKYMIYINYFIINGAGQYELLHQKLVGDVIGAMQGGPDAVVTSLVNTFLSGGGGGAFASQAQMDQWYVPKALAKDIGSGGGGTGKFIDILSFDGVQSGLPGFKVVVNPDVRTPLWTLMQQHANLDLNEMFVELVEKDGKQQPTLFLRTHPFTFKSYTGSMSGINYFQDLSGLTIGGNSIISSETRLHEHDRFTFMVYLNDSIETSTNTFANSVGLLDGQFPYINVAGCKRYGLTVYQRAGDYMLNEGSPSTPDPQLLLEFNQILQHWYENNAHLEDASLVIAGRPEVRLGKRVDVVNSHLLCGHNSLVKSYYLEAYVDQWEYGQPWTQQLMMTRGVFISGGQEKYTYQVYGNSNDFIGTSHIRR